MKVCQREGTMAEGNRVECVEGSEVGTSNRREGGAMWYLKAVWIIARDRKDTEFEQMQSLGTV